MEEEMDCRLFFQCTGNSIDDILALLCEKFGIYGKEWSDYQFNTFEIHLDENDEADIQRAAQFPDGFLFFSHSMELYFYENPIENTNCILTLLWANGIPAVAVCDYEQRLDEKGGYKSRNIPWVC